MRPSGSTQTFDLNGEQVFHVAYPDPSDPLGCISPLSRIAEAVLTDAQIQEAQHSSMKHGIFPRAVITAGRLPDMGGMPRERPTLTPEQREDLISAIRGVYSGAINMDEPFIIDGLIENIQPFGLKPSELSFKESGEMTKARVLQGFGVSPILLGEIEGANRASAYIADEIFCQNKINPLIEMVSQAMTEWLGPQFAKAREKLVVWIERATPRDAEMQLKRFESAARLGFVNQNEFRRHVLNLPDVDGGDEFREPALMLPRARRSANVDDPTLNPFTLERMKLNGSAPTH